MPDQCYFSCSILIDLILTSYLTHLYGGLFVFSVQGNQEVKPRALYIFTTTEQLTLNPSIIFRLEFKDEIVAW